MEMKLLVARFVFVYLWTSSMVASQSIYIDKDPAYYSLPCCAQIPLSIAVRDMSQGCGDGGQLTSYNCFCTTRSSYFSALISTGVQARCMGNGTAASQALAVFSNYCTIGSNGTQTSATFTGTKILCTSTLSATPAGSPTVTLPVATSRPSTTAPPPANTSTSGGREALVDPSGIILGLSFLLAIALVS
ncbi:hypothetical protein B0J14DRAFT_588208 [Halenospora varia]|nr:hypothetical protein B0J14DRAFT_588208 [Halenospora varia]